MTLVLGHRFFQGLVMIADSRTTFHQNGKIVALQDNAQKIFRISPHVYIAFCGDFDFANKMLVFLLMNIKKNPKLLTLYYFSRQAPKILKYAYKILSEEKNDQRPVGFMIGGVDFHRPARDEKGRVIGLALFDVKLLKIEFPNGKIYESNSISSSLIMGSGEPALADLENDFKQMQFGRFDSSLYFNASVMDIALKQKVRELKIDTVGGLSQIITVDIHNSGFQPYQTSSELLSGEIDLELALNSEGNRFIQRNLKTGEEIPLLYPDEILKICDPKTNLFAFC